MAVKAYDSSEVLTLLATDVDSYEDDFDENNPIAIKQENDSRDDEDEFEEDESLENEILHPPDSNPEGY